MNINFLIQSIIITIALSMDALITSMGYGFSNIKIPIISVFLIDSLCTFFIVISLLLGNFIERLLPNQFATLLSAGILLLLGILKLFDTWIKNWVTHTSFTPSTTKGITHMIASLFFVYANPNTADKDASNILSPKEAIPLAIALSFDGLAVGFSTGISNIPIIYILITSLVIEGISIIIGSYIGQKICKHLPIDFSWTSGFLLILLAIVKLLSK